MSMRDVLLINGDITKPLDELIKELLNNGDHGLAALKVLLNNTSKEASVGAIKSLLTDAGYGLSALNADLDNITGKVDGNTTNIGNIVNSLSSAHSKLDNAINVLNAVNQTVNNLSNMSSVKLVQRGVVSAGTVITLSTTEFRASVSGGDYSYYIDIPISSIDTSKSVVSIETFNCTTATWTYVGRITSATNLRVYVSTGTEAGMSYKLQSGFAWTVTEYR